MLDGCVDWPAEAVARYRSEGYWQGETLGQLLRARAHATPECLAVVDSEHRWSYRELDRRADCLAAGLLRHGIARDMRVLIQLPNIAEFLSLCFALFRVGAVPVLALPAHREADIVHLAELSGASAYVIAATHLGFDYRPLARAVRKQVPSVGRVFVVGECQEFTALADLEREESAGDLGAQSSSRDVALLLLSGGTTGAPKLIPRTHDDYTCNVRLAAEVAGLTQHTRYLVSLPIAHNFPLGCPGALGTIHAGGTVVLCGEPSPETAFRWIAAEKVTTTALIPPLVSLWLEAAEWMDADLSSLQLLQVGGARLKSQTAARIRPVLGCALQQVYGMAEGLLNFTRLDDPEAIVLTTQGRPMTRHDELRIVNIAGAPVPSGELGELEVRGPYTIRGYYQAEAYNRRAFTADGYYRTGDLARQLPSGHLIVEGRSKDVINRGGDKVPVEEVENQLLAHPSIFDVAIVGVPDDTLGECSCACVITRGKAPSLPELKAHLNRIGLAAFKWPDRLLIVEHFPQTTLGKVDKSALARLASAGRTTEQRATEL